MAADPQAPRSAISPEQRPPSAPDNRAANAVAYARRQRPPMKRFAYDLRGVLTWKSLSRQMIYKWERQQARVPASVLIACAILCGLTVDELLNAGQRSAMHRE